MEQNSDASELRILVQYEGASDLPESGMLQVSQVNGACRFEIPNGLAFRLLTEDDKRRVRDWLTESLSE